MFEPQRETLKKPGGAAWPSFGAAVVAQSEGLLEGMQLQRRSDGATERGTRARDKITGRVKKNKKQSERGESNTGRGMHEQGSLRAGQQIVPQLVQGAVPAGGEDGSRVGMAFWG